MLRMKHIPCFRAAAAWGNFSALRRNLILLLSQFLGASNQMLPHSTISLKRFETVRTFHRRRVFFKCTAADCKWRFKVQALENVMSHSRQYKVVSSHRGCDSVVCL